MSTGKITLHKVLNLAFWLIVIALLINIGHLSLPRLRVYARALTPGPAALPYTSILKETVYDAQGHSKPGGNYTWAVRSDGSRVTRMEAAGHVQRNVDFSSGKRVEIDELHNRKSTTTYSDVDANSWVRDPKSGCVNSMNGQSLMPEGAVVGKEDVSGYQTVKIAGGGMTGWYAPEYGCALLKFEADWGSNEKSEQELVTLIAGEPSATLFAIPDNFTEAAPSKLFGSLPPDVARRYDDRYYAHHVQE